MDMDSALRIIIAASPVAAGEAFDCIRALKARSPMIGVRFNSVVKTAFSDPDATFTPEQRTAITELIDISSESRDAWFRMRITVDEYEAIRQSADSAGLSMSEWARRRMFGGEP